MSEIDDHYSNMYLGEPIESEPVSKTHSNISVPKLTKSQIEEQYWLEFVRWAKSNSHLSNQYGPAWFTLERFWFWYAEKKLEDSK